MALQDQGAIMRSGMGLVPNYAEEMYRKQQMQLQQGQLAMQQQAAAAKQQEAQREQIRAASFDQDVQGYLAQPTPQSLISLMAKYPEQSEALKRAYEAQTSQSQAGDMRMAGEIYGFAQNGRYDLAANKMRSMIEAQKRGGQPDDPEDMAVLADLESDDPLRQKRALGIVGMQLAIASGDKFATTYGELNPKLSPQMKEYDDRVAKFGKEAADRWLAVQDTKLVPVQKGGSIYSADDLINGGNPAPKGGDPESSNPSAQAVSNGRSVVEQLFPQARITQNRRDPNSALGKKNPNSYHIKTGGAVDVAPIEGMTFSEYVSKFKQAGYQIIEAKNEVGAGRSKHATGDHWHVVIGKGPGRPVKVTSIQQARRLPPGTQFVTPDGRTMTR